MNKSNLNALLKKLYCKNQKEIFVFNAPREFLSVLWDIGKEIKVKREAKKNEQVSLSLVFIRNQNEIAKHVNILGKRLTEDAVVWFAVPKKNSKTYESELPEGYGWEDLLEIGYKQVSSISIDKDWTGLRFKK